jgi:HK97 family phage major capsid protein
MPGGTSGAAWAHIAGDGGTLAGWMHIGARLRPRNVQTFLEITNMPSAFDQLKESIDGVGTNFEAFRKMDATRHSEFRKSVDDRFDDLETRINEQEAKGKIPGRHDRGRDGGLIHRMATDERVQAALKNSASATIEFANTPLRELLLATKAPVMGDGFAGSPSSGFPVLAQRLDQIYNDPRRLIRVLDVLPHQSVRDTNSIQYVTLDASYSPTAAVQATEGADKAEANVDTTLQTANLVTIANHISASSQVLSDVPMLQTYLTNLLRQAVLLQLEQQIVNGGSSMVTGLVEAAGSAATVTSTAAADKVGEVAVQLQSLGWQPNVLLIHPEDLFAIQSERATGGGDGQYVAGGWNNPASGRIWGALQPVATPVLAKGSALVFDSSQTVIFDREVINLRLGFVGSQFTQNLVTLLVEGRFGFAVFSSSAIKKVSI